jgi:hypothetical protein
LALNCLECRQSNFTASTSKFKFKLFKTFWNIERSKKFFIIEKVEANKIRVTVSACGGPPDMSGFVSHVSKHDTASSRDSPCLFLSCPCYCLVTCCIMSIVICVDEMPRHYWSVWDCIIWSFLICFFYINIYFYVLKFIFNISILKWFKII